MANADIKVTKTIKWNEVVKRVTADHGIPAKQVEETVGQVSETIAKLLEENRPQKVGTAIVIDTPIAAIRGTRIPSEVRVDTASGKKVERDECISISAAANKKFVEAANIGLVLDKASAEGGKEEKASKKKSA